MEELKSLVWYSNSVPNLTEEEWVLRIKQLNEITSIARIASYNVREAKEELQKIRVEKLKRTIVQDKLRIIYAVEVTSYSYEDTNTYIDSHHAYKPEAEERVKQLNNLKLGYKTRIIPISITPGQPLTKLGLTAPLLDYYMESKN